MPNASLRECWPLWLAGLAMLGQIAAQLVSGDHGDLPVFLGAAERLQTGASPYLTWIPTRNGHALQFVYPPLAAWVFAPLTWVPASTAYWLWALLKIAMALRTLQLLLGFAPSSITTQRKVLFEALVVLVFLRFALDDLALGQWTIVMLFLAIEGLHQLERGRTVRGAALIALGASLKLLPLLLLFGLGAERKWRALAWAVGFGVAFTAIPMIQFGPAHFTDRLHEWTLSLDPAHNPDVADAGGNNPGIQGISGMLHAYFQEPSAMLLNTLRLILLAGSLWLLPRIPQRSCWPFYAYLLLITPLIFPHQQAYAFLFTVPAVAVALGGALAPVRSDPSRRLGLVLLVTPIVLLLGSAHVILGSAGYAFAQQAKMITWGSLVLVAVLFIARPNVQLGEL
jgi:Glycosyltransferase family 87